ncbi:HAD family phosphatase [Microbacterium esteraromaticum]|uniref:HAD family phosphatase n=2 Tax=Microbacterium esteraromaticum TaxID=57043 RepID=A0A7D7WHB8_9MICO|nr:HAD family phosphatase [Microbacterium esteraromaticum]QMU98131.1 HAD family phosphatase [Microbacterium esteraromaticum]
MSRKPRAVLWDMDGTLVNTEPYWMSVETELVESYGGTWTHDDALKLIGSNLLESGRVLQQAGVELEPAEIVDLMTDRVAERLRTQGVPFRPGARELLADLREQGIPTALVTMSLRRMALDVVAQIDFTAFDLVVAGDDVERPKPFPDPYLTAAAQLGIDIADAVVIEDSPTGVTSGAASGAVTLGVPHMVSLEGFGADELWPTLEGRTAADIIDLHVRLAKEGAR